MELAFLGCKRISKRVTCSLIGKNVGNKNNNWTFYANSNSHYQSKAFLPSGVHKAPNKVTIGDIADNDDVSYNFPKNIPIKMEYNFSDIPTDIKGLLLLQIKSHNAFFEFNNVSITE